MHNLLQQLRAGLPLGSLASILFSFGPIRDFTIVNICLLSAFCSLFL